MRLFVALSIPAEIKEGLSHLTDYCREGGLKARWVRSQGIHLTLKFLGEVDSVLIPEIEDCVAGVAQKGAPMEFQVSGLGVFPSPRRARVIWSGLENTAGDVTGLARLLDSSISTLGFERERRPFRPHLTLGRFRDLPDATRLERVLGEHGTVSVGEFRVDEMALFQSILRPQGAEYRALCRFPLGSSHQGMRKKQEEP